MEFDLQRFAGNTSDWLWDYRLIPYTAIWYYYIAGNGDWNSWTSTKNKLRWGGGTN